METLNADEYMGDVDVSVTGITCQAWNHISPHIHVYVFSWHYPDISVSAAQNHCRDVKGDGGYLVWCFTMDVGVRWEPCDVKHCSDSRFISLDIELNKTHLTRP